MLDFTDKAIHTAILVALYAREFSDLRGLGLSDAEADETARRALAAFEAIHAAPEPRKTSGLTWAEVQALRPISVVDGEGDRVTVDSDGRWWYDNAVGGGYVWRQDEPPHGGDLKHDRYDLAD